MLSFLYTEQGSCEKCKGMIERITTDTQTTPLVKCGCNTSTVFDDVLDNIRTLPFRISGELCTYQKNNLIMTGKYEYFSNLPIIFRDSRKKTPKITEHILIMYSNPEKILIFYEGIDKFLYTPEYNNFLEFPNNFSYTIQEILKK